MKNKIYIFNGQQMAWNHLFLMYIYYIVLYSYSHETKSNPLFWAFNYAINILSWCQSSFKRFYLLRHLIQHSECFIMPRIIYVMYISTYNMHTKAWLFLWHTPWGPSGALVINQGTIRGYSLHRVGYNWGKVNNEILL